MKKELINAFLKAKENLTGYRLRQFVRDFATGPDISIGEMYETEFRKQSGSDLGQPFSIAPYESSVQVGMSSRPASRESIIGEFIQEIDGRIAKGEITEAQARGYWPMYDLHKQPGK